MSLGTSKVVLIFLIVASIVCVILSIFCIEHVSKFLGTSGTLLTFASIAQLKVSGTLDEIFEKRYSQYADINKYPFGPPSSYTRSIMDEADKPIIFLLKSYFFYRKDASVHLVVIGGVLQIFSLWL